LDFGFRPVNGAGLFLIMKPTLFILLAAISTLLFAGCRMPNDRNMDDQEYSNMPWNTPQDWEGSRSIPGMSGQSY
jgi:hypothetical protein